MAKILKEKGFNDVLPGQKLCRQCVTEYEKLTKPPENENMTEIVKTENSQDELASDDDFLLYESPKKKLNSTLKSIGVFPVNIHGLAQHSRISNAKGKLKKVLNVYKENISAAYVSDYLKENQLWIRSSISLMAVLSNKRITKTLLICAIITKISITIFSVSLEEMVNVCADLEDHFAKSETMPVT